MADTFFIDRKTPIYAEWLNDVNRLVYDLPSTVSGKGAELIGTESGRSVQARLDNFLCIFDAGGFTTEEVFDVHAFAYSIDLTSKINIAISVAATLGQKLFCPAGGYLYTAGIGLPEHGHLVGEKTSQYPTGFGVAPKATTFKFVPSTPSDAVSLTGTTHASFRIHNSMEGIHFIAGNANARYGFNCDHGIYGKYSDLSFEGFQYNINCSGTINNRFENCHLAAPTVANLRYAGNIETTDVWEQCTFTQCPSAVLTLGSTVGIRFVNCLFEQCQTYLADIAKETQGMTFDNCYGEDLCFSGAPTSAAFRVGAIGTTTVTQTHLIINGGVYGGRNAGAVGTFLDIDFCNGVIIGGMTVSRFTNGIKTTTNTTDASIVSRGWTALSLTNIIINNGTTTDFTKMTGIWPNSLLNVTNGQRIRARQIESQFDLVYGRSLLGPNANFNSAASGVANTLALGNGTSTTVGAAGGAAALPATPLGYLVAFVGTTQVKIPYYN